MRARDVAPDRAGQNAHTRRVLTDDADDIVVFGKRGLSPLLTEWGGLSVNDGYLQRSAVFPRLLDAKRFLKWWQAQKVELVAENNPA